MRRFVFLVCVVVPLLVHPCPDRATADDGLLQEFGSMVVDNYEEMGCTLDSLNGTPFRDALFAKLVNPMGWTQSAPFPKDNDACTSAMIDVAGSNLPDTVDLSLWIGQSWTFIGPPGAVLHMSSAHGQGCSFTRDTGNNDHDEVRMGDSDNEVAIWATCRFLQNQNNEDLMHAVMRMNHHSHLNLGYATFCDQTGHHTAAWAGSRLGTLFYGWYQHGHPCGPCRIAAAWCYMNWDYQFSDVCARATYCKGPAPIDHPDWGCQYDYLQGNRDGLGYGGQPPACGSGEPFSDYTYFWFCDCWGRWPRP